MSATNPQRVNSHESRGNVSQSVARFVDAVEDLAVELDAPDNVVTEFVDAGEAMADLVEETTQEVESNAEQIETNADEIEEEKERRIGEIEGCHSRITSVEDDLDEINVEDANLDGRNQGSTVENHPMTEPQTSLERVVDLDEEIIEEELTANQQRARHVATDPRHYGDKTGRGWMLTSNDVSKVLRSGTDCDGRTQTVSRVMDFLDRLGDDEVEVTTHRGTRRVYFSEAIADRLTTLATADNTDNGVVITGAEEAVI